MKELKKTNTVFKFNSCTSQVIQDIPNYPGCMETPEGLTKEELGYASLYSGSKGKIRDSTQNYPKIPTKMKERQHCRGNSKQLRPGCDSC